MASAREGTEQSTAGAGAEENCSGGPKDYSLAVDDIVLESDLLDMNKIKTSITFESFLRQQAKIIKRSRSRSRGLPES